MLDPFGTPAGCASVAEASSTLMIGTRDLDKIRPLRGFSRVLAHHSNPRTLSEHKVVIVTA